MPSTNTFAAAVEGTDEALNRESLRYARRLGSIGQMFGPWATGLIGLAIAFTLFGFSYRFNQYRFGNDVASRVAGIKFCSEERKTLQAAAAELTSKTDNYPASPGVSIPEYRVPAPKRGDLFEFATAARPQSLGAWLAPGRSPPIMSLPLA
jgi:hypothetical protein